MANSIPPFDTSNGVKGAAVNFLPSTGAVNQQSPLIGAITGTKIATSTPSSGPGGSSGSDLGTTILNGALGFLTGGLGGLFSSLSGGVSGGISGGGGTAKPTFFDFISGVFGGKKSK